MRKLLLLFFLISLGWSFSQTIENVDFKAEGKTIVVKYDYSHPNPDSLINIQIQFKDQQGTVVKPITIYGDIKNVMPGKDKRIVWDALSDGVKLSGKYNVELFFYLIDNCELDGKIFYSNCIKYFGECKNDQANGLGTIFFNGFRMSGIFKNNKIQDHHINYYRETDKSSIFGPNQGPGFHGPCIEIDFKNHVYYIPYKDKKPWGFGLNLDTWQIPKPVTYNKDSFCDQNGYGAKDFDDCILIPKSNYIIYNSDKETSQGDRYWISVVDLTQNKIIQSFGSLKNPLSGDFIGFDKGNNPIYEYSGRYRQFNIQNGDFKDLNSLPLELSTTKIFEENVKKTSDTSFTIGKFLFLQDSSYIVVLNKKGWVINPFDFNFGTGSKILKYDKFHVKTNSFDFPNNNIWDIAIHEKSNRIALSHISKDSTFLSYFDLNTLSIQSLIFAKSNNDFNDKKNTKPGQVSFSRTGKYLIYERASDNVSFYLGAKLYFGIKGGIYDFDQNDDVVLVNGYSSLLAYDLNKKSLICGFELGDDYTGTKFFNLNDNLYLISGRPLGTNGIEIHNFQMPKPLIQPITFKFKE
jgi:hypothetical protein